jgi:hypothetical protein
MQLGDKTAFGIGGVGLGAAAIGMTIEHVYPHAAPWVWQALFWGGVAFLTVSALYLFYLHSPRNRAITVVSGQTPKGGRN